MLVDAGDFSQGSPYFNYFKGRVEIDALNYMGYDAVTLGNHEFDNGLDSLAAILKEAKFPVVCANYLVEGTVLEGLVKPYVVLDKRGIRVGVFGLGVNPESLISMSNFLPLKYIDPIPVADSIATLLKTHEHCDLVVCLSHFGTMYEPKDDPTQIIRDELIARNTHNIDMIIGGHSHKYYSNVYIKDLDNHDVLLSQMGKGGARLGKITVELDSLRNVKLPTEETLFVDESLDSIADMEYVARLAPEKAFIDKELSIHLGDAPEDMVVDRPESNLVNWAADALLEMARQHSGQAVDMSVVNIGGLRCNWNKGEITLGSLFELMPFENELVIITLTGQDLLDLAEIFAQQGGQGMSGMTIEIKDRHLHKVLLNGYKIAPQMLYRVATNEYIASGQDFLYPLGRHTDLWTEHEKIRDVYAEYIKQHPVVKGVVDGRTKVLR